MDHLEDGQLKDLGQALAAELRVRRQGIPALGREGLVGFSEARGGRDHAVLEPGPDAVAVGVEGGKLGFHEGGGRGQDRRHRLCVEVGIAVRQEGGQTRRRKGEVQALQGGAEGHGKAPKRRLQA